MICRVIPTERFKKYDKASACPQISMSNKSGKMKTKKAELEVDFIGGQDPLSEEEEKALSEFLKKQKPLPEKQEVFSKSKTVIKDELSS